MPKLDIEEKFKKDISKEVATLKEFLISQGKEIVKLKQENKVTFLEFELDTLNHFPPPVAARDQFCPL